MAPTPAEAFSVWIKPIALGAGVFVVLAAVVLIVWLFAGDKRRQTPPDSQP